MKPKAVSMSHVYGESNLGLHENYLTQLKASIELLRRGNINGKVNSNWDFGWQTEMLPHSGVFEEITQKITEKAFIFCKNLKNFSFSKVEITALWANINYKGDINWPHNHQGDLAGVFYLHTPKNSGNIIRDSFNYNQNCKIGCYLWDTQKKIITPKNNKIVLFDSSCIHYVTKNKSDDIRISMSFNIKIYD